MKEYIKKANLDFKNLKNIPSYLYKKLGGLIAAYKVYGSYFINKKEHPFDSEIEKGDFSKHPEQNFDDKTKEYADSFFKRTGHPDFIKFNTAIQQFKKEYRFDTEPSESSQLKIFFNNVILNRVFKNDEYVHSFNTEKNTGNLFDKKQIEYKLDITHFFIWIPSFKSAIIWIVDGILKHSNIKGKRDFEKEKKEVIIKSYEYNDPNSSDFPKYKKIALEIFDKDSYIKKEPDTFIKELTDNLNILKSVCDLTIFFTTCENGKINFYKNDIFQSTKVKKIPKIDEGEGLLYRFIIIYDKK